MTGHIVSPGGALTCGCVTLGIIIGAVIYQGMVLAPVVKQADAHKEAFSWKACSTVRESQEKVLPNVCETADRVISLIDHPEERFLEVAPPMERGASAVLEGPAPRAPVNEGATALKQYGESPSGGHHSL